MGGQPGERGRREVSDGSPRGSLGGVRAAAGRLAPDRAMRRNLFAVYGGLLGGNGVTLALVTVLARTLGPAAWGRVLMAQALAAWIGLVHGYGFGLAGTRAVARLREDAAGLADVASSVLAGQGVLAAATLPLLVLVPWLWPGFRHQAPLVAAAWCLSLANALTPAWYYQGRERLAPLATVQLAAALLFLLLVLLLVHGPGEAARVVWLQAATTAAGALALLGRLARETPLRPPPWASVRRALGMGGGLFTYRLATSLYTTANVLLLGLFLPAGAVGLFGSAERICRTVARLIHQLTTVLLPRVSHTLGRDPAAARRLVRASLAVTLALGLALGAGTAVLAPWIVRLVLGRGYGPAVPLVRLLSPLIAIIPLGGVLGLQWMLPLGLDRPFLAVELAAAGLNLAGVVALVPRLGMVGMAVSALGAETLVAVGMAVVLQRRGQGLLGPAPAARAGDRG